MDMRLGLALCAVLALSIGMGSCSSLDDTDIRGAAWDTRLTALQIKDANGSLDINFRQDVSEYEISTVEEEVYILVKCTNGDIKPSIRGVDVPQDAWHLVPLVLGANNIEIRVSIATSSVMNTSDYRVQVVRVRSDNALLSKLSFSPTPSLNDPKPDPASLSTNSDPVFNIAFGPVFKSGIFEYELIVPYGATNVGISCIPVAAAGSAATIKFNGATVQPSTVFLPLTIGGAGTAGNPESFGLPVTNTIEVRAKDGDADPVTYEIHVRRRGAYDGKDIKEFIFANVDGPQRNAFIYPATKRVVGELTLSQEMVGQGFTTQNMLAKLNVAITVPAGARVAVDPAFQDTEGRVDFSNSASVPVRYVVTAESGDQETYYVSVYAITSPFSVMSVEYLGKVVDEIQLGDIFMDDPVELSFYVRNIGYDSLGTNDITVSSAVGGTWALEWIPDDEVLPVIKTNASKLAVVRYIGGYPAGPVDDMLTFTTLSGGYDSPYDSLPRFQSIDIQLTAEAYDTQDGNLFIAEWAETAASGSGGNGDGYIELRNFSSSPILIDRYTQICYSSGKRLTLLKYGFDNDYDSYTHLTGNVKLGAGKSLVIVQRGGTGGNGEANFFSYTWAGNVQPPADMMVFLVDKVPSTGKLIENGERLTSAPVWFERQAPGAASPTVWGETPTWPAGTSAARIVSVTSNFIGGAANNANAKTASFWNRYSSSQANRKAGQWPK